MGVGRGIEGLYTKRRAVLSTGAGSRLWRPARLLSILCLAAVLAPVSAFPGESAEETLLRLYFGTEPRLSDNVKSPRQVESLCMEMGDRAIPALKTAIARRDQVWQEAVDSLLYVDSPQVIDILKREYAENPPKDEKANRFLKDRLCLAMSVATSPQDVGFLINQLDGPRDGAPGSVARSAALSLAVLKPSGAKEPLEKRLVSYGEYRYPVEHDCIHLALDNIDGATCSTPQDKNDWSRDSVIYAVLRFGVPRTGFSNQFYDKRSWRVWTRDGKKWTHKPGKIDVSDFPAFSFDVLISRDGNRAVCGVMVFTEAGAFETYNFVLRKEKDRWRVIRLMPGATS